jgi:hypothetical protein
VLKALIFGVKEYATKTGFYKKHYSDYPAVLIGFSCLHAVKALGKENVSCCFNAFKYSSKGSMMTV